MTTFLIDCLPERQPAPTRVAGVDCPQPENPLADRRAKEPVGDRQIGKERKDDHPVANDHRRKCLLFPWTEGELLRVLVEMPVSETGDLADGDPVGHVETKKRTMATKREIVFGGTVADRARARP